MINLKNQIYNFLALISFLIDKARFQTIK